eukprot:3957935-Alexandrium_andersonii.AAC.1
MATVPVDLSPNFALARARLAAIVLRVAASASLEKRSDSVLALSMILDQEWLLLVACKRLATLPVESDLAAASRAPLARAGHSQGCDDLTLLTASATHLRRWHCLRAARAD